MVSITSKVSFVQIREISLWLIMILHKVRTLSIILKEMKLLLENFCWKNLFGFQNSSDAA